MKAFPGIASVRACASTRLEIGFTGEERVSVDLAPWIADVRPLQGLRDPDIFATVRVAFDGGGLAWGAIRGPDGEGDLDMDGDQLWRLAGEQAQQLMPVDAFRSWRARHRLSRAAAATVLGLPRRTVAAYDRGSEPIPRTVLLACRGWEAMQRDAA